MKKYDTNDLLYLMQQLRHPEYGCDWDKAQTMHSLTRYSIEEVYELVDAIEQNDSEHIKEELGDVLLQIVFYTQIAEEEGRFAFADVVDQLVTKLVRRHPHVFANNDLHQIVTQELGAEAVKAQWDLIKQEERKNKQQHGLLDDVPLALPALIRAQKLQKRASDIGFDWPNAEAAIEKIYEELDELKQAMQQGDKKALLEELGDVLFCCVNTARHLKLDAEEALMASNSKFSQRFAYIEKQLKQQGKNFEQSSLMEMDALWEESKKQLKNL